jgi:hypothetical protein
MMAEQSMNGHRLVVWYNTRCPSRRRIGPHPSTAAGKAVIFMSGLHLSGR